MRHTGTTEVTDYSYDDNGNQIYKSIGTLKPVNAADVEGFSISVSGESPDNSSVTISRYDGFNQLINTTVGDKNVLYEYNADGLRISRTVNGAVTQHIWDGDQIALELDGSGNVTNKYVRGINLIYAEVSGGLKYYLFNGHGDVVQLTGNDGSVTKSYDYDAFGNEKNPDAADTNVFRYCGEYYDKETGTIYLRARYYDPGIGRFISEDSVWGKDKDPLSLNLYTYCGNNPINAWDPSGHEYGKVTDFVSDYEGSIKYGNEIVGWNVTFSYPGGKKVTRKYNGVQPPSFYTENKTSVIYSPIYRPYADISI